MAATGHRCPLLRLGRCIPLLFLLRLLGLTSLLPSQQAAAGAGDYLGVEYVNCMRNASSLSTNFTRNLESALSNLTTLSSQGSKYAITTAGPGAGNNNNNNDEVYAMFQCRGDQSVDLCRECMQNATARLPQRDCPYSLEARIQLEGCYVHYDNQSLFVLDTSPVAQFCNTPKTINVTVVKGIEAVVENVMSLAPKQGGFATAMSAIGVSGEYALAQCLGYLNETECSQCLLRYPYSTVCDGSWVGGRKYLASCFYRAETYSFFEATSLPPPPPPPSAPPASPPHGSALALPPPPTTKPPGSKTTIIAVGVVVGVVILTSALCASVVCRYKGTKIKGVKRVERAASWVRQLPQLFSLQELQEATEHFHPTNKLGEGGFGVVYKGTLLGGEKVAIKKLFIKSQAGKQEFLNEVNVITSVQHKNLIRLLGCCAEGPENILVYEYLPNKSLNFSLFGENRRLNWPTRYGIILGMAKGLAYLHEESHVRIIHRDIKPSNILLDDQLNPVIADFGLARLVKEDATHITTRVAGTIGYVAPEYVIRGDLSEKVDVYSFGLVALEICTGKQNNESSLLTWVWENYQQGTSLDLVDEKLGNDFSPEQAIRMVCIALLCTQGNPKQRPAMSMVTRWLSGTSDILEVPTRPTFLDYSDYIVTNQLTSAHSTAARPGLSGHVQSFSEFLDPR